MQWSNLAKVAVALFSILASSCERSRQPPEPAASPRLVTFGPALTAMAFDLGLGDHVVGVDQESRPPPGHPRPVVGSALSIRVEPIAAVKPDILAVCMSPGLFEPIRLAVPAVRIEHFEFRSLEDIARAMERLGRILGEEELGAGGARRFREKLARVRASAEGLPRPRAIFVVGHESPLAVGRDDFVDELISIAGGENAFAKRHSGWRSISVETVAEIAPEVILCQAERSSEETARSYWASAGSLSGAAAPRVEVFTDPRWTVPAGHIADFAEELARRLHPELRAAGTEP